MATESRFRQARDVEASPTPTPAQLESFPTLSAARDLKIGPHVVSPPVILAPMAGVTDAPFRVLCSSFGGGLYVNQMVTARALLEGHKVSWGLTRFHPDEQVRSLQLYGTDPISLGEAVRRLVSENLVDHIDLNFGCPAPKVTRNGGGAAIPFKHKLLRNIINAAVQAAESESAGQVPVTIKFRMGIDDHHLTYLETGKVAEDLGVKAIALHARTAKQHYAPSARWEHIAALKEAVTTIPVLGNGDIFEVADAERMMAETGCDGVVIGRGCLGRPWLFRDLTLAARGDAVPDAPSLGDVCQVIERHVDLIVDWQDGNDHLPHFRKHLAWYLKGYPVGGTLRGQAGLVTTRSDVLNVLEQLDHDAYPVEGAERFVRSHSSALRKVVLPEGWLDDPHADVALPRGAEALVSGG